MFLFYRNKFFNIITWLNVKFFFIYLLGKWTFRNDLAFKKGNFGKYKKLFMLLLPKYNKNIHPKKILYWNLPVVYDPEEDLLTLNRTEVVHLLALSHASSGYNLPSFQSLHWNSNFHSLQSPYKHNSHYLKLLLKKIRKKRF